MCLRFMCCERRVAKTEAESVDDIVAASSSEVAQAKWIFVQAIPESHHTNSPVKTVVSSTPTVERTAPGATTGRTSANRVSMPPENRMMVSATMPMNCALSMLENCSPNPSLPKSMPTKRKSRRTGTPKR